MIELERKTVTELNIKFLKMKNLYGRQIAFCQLKNADDQLVFDGSLAEALTFAKANGVKISNAHDVLHDLVVMGGFAA